MDILQFVYLRHLFCVKNKCYEKEDFYSVSIGINHIDIYQSTIYSKLRPGIIDIIPMRIPIGWQASLSGHRIISFLMLTISEEVGA